MGKWGVGMPAALLLEDFGALIVDAFDETPYWVGSSLRTTKYRDVDVRLILPDEAFDEMFPNIDPLCEQNHPKWVAFTLAFSMLGSQMTGLPIDFQIQRRTEANAQHNKARNALGIRRRLAPASLKENGL